jgi:hypothetical protein
VANYVYDLPTVDTNRETYHSTRRVVAAATLTELAQRAA